MKILSWLAKLSLSEPPKLGTPTALQEFEKSRESDNGSENRVIPITPTSEIATIVGVIRTVRNCFHLETVALSLAVASVLRDTFKIHTRLFYDMPAMNCVPPKWFDGVLVTASSPVNEDITCIVDFNFRQKFLLARPTENYCHFSQSIPDIFVGTARDLELEIDRISTELLACLQEQQLHVPPWRTPDWLKSIYQRCFNGSAENGEILLNCVSESMDDLKGVQQLRSNHNQWSASHSSAIFAALTVRLALADKSGTQQLNCLEDRGGSDSMRERSSVPLPHGISLESTSSIKTSEDQNQDYTFEKVPSSPDIAADVDRSGLSILLE